MGKKAGPRGGTRKGGKRGKGRSISNIKKTNIKHNKLAKKGKMKPIGSKPRFLEGGHLQAKKIAAAGKKTLSKLEMEEEAERLRLYNEEKEQMEEETYAQMADMMDPEDLEFLKLQSNKNNSCYEVLQSSASDKMKLKKSSHNEDSELAEYERKALERQSAEEDFKNSEDTLENGRKRLLLPVRTKAGWQQRSGTVIQDNFDDKSCTIKNDIPNGLSEPDGLSSDSNVDAALNSQCPSEPISVVDILAKRRLMISKAKVQIGSMATNFLEGPEERIQVLEKLIKMVNEDTTDSNYNSQNKKEKVNNFNFFR